MDGRRGTAAYENGQAAGVGPSPAFSGIGVRDLPRGVAFAGFSEAVGRDVGRASAVSRELRDWGCALCRSGAAVRRALACLGHPCCRRRPAVLAFAASGGRAVCLVRGLPVFTAGVWRARRMPVLVSNAAGACRLVRTPPGLVCAVSIPYVSRETCRSLRDVQTFFARRGCRMLDADFWFHHSRDVCPCRTVYGGHGSPPLRVLTSNRGITRHYAFL